MNKRTILSAAFAITIAIAPAVQADSSKDIRIILKTDKGDIEATLYPSKAPITVASFLNLAKRGYYDGTKFHRVIPGFMIQGGDPTGTGGGGPGYEFEDECTPDLKHDGPGTLSMAKPPRPDSNGSQFFVTVAPTPHLDGQHTVFGRVAKGQSVANEISKAPTDPNDRPLEDVTITSVEILDPTDNLFSSQAKRIEEWNAVLDKR